MIRQVWYSYAVSRIGKVNLGRQVNVGLVLERCNLAFYGRYGTVG